MGFLWVARVIVAIWLLSPHSAKKVSKKASRKTGLRSALSFLSMGV